MWVSYVKMWTKLLSRRNVKWQKQVQKFLLFSNILFGVFHIRFMIFFLHSMFGEITTKKNCCTLIYYTSFQQYFYKQFTFINEIYLKFYWGYGTNCRLFFCNRSFSSNDTLCYFGCITTLKKEIWNHLYIMLFTISYR